MLSASYELYVQDIISLTRSLVIKSVQSIEATNTFLGMSGIPVLEDPTTWKYYLNIAGEYHFTDTEMYIKSLDDQTEVLFTKQMLATHPLTAAEYRAGGEYLEALSHEFPEQVELIQRIMHPVDMTAAINAENYEILYYDKSKVGAGEMQLIGELQQWVYNYTRRWDVSAYTLTDELYTASALGVMYLAIPHAIINIRLRSSNTQHAADYHIWNYLADFARLDKFKDRIFHGQALWLYRNISYITRNAGLDSTLDFIVEGFALPYGLELNVFDLRQDSTDLQTDLKNVVRVSKTEYGRDTLDESNTLNLTPRDIIDKVATQALLNPENLVEDTENLTEAVLASPVGTITTGVIEVNVADTTHRGLINAFGERFTQWFYLASKGLFAYNFSLPVPGKEPLIISTSEAAVLLLYAANMFQDTREVNIPTLNLWDIMHQPTETMADIKDIAEDSSYSEDLINAYFDNLVVEDVIATIPEFIEHVNAISNRKVAHILHLSKTSDPYAQAQMRSVIGLCYKDEEVTLSPFTTYDEFLSDIQADFSGFSIADWAILAKNITRHIVGHTEVNEGITSPYYEMMEIMRILTSYTVNFVAGEGSAALIPMDHPYAKPISSILRLASMDPIHNLGGDVRPSIHRTSVTVVSDADVTLPAIADISLTDSAAIPADYEVEDLSPALDNRLIPNGPPGVIVTRNYIWPMANFSNYGFNLLRNPNFDMGFVNGSSGAVIGWDYARLRSGGTPVNGVPSIYMAESNYSKQTHRQTVAVEGLSAGDWVTVGNWHGQRGGGNHESVFRVILFDRDMNVLLDASDRYITDIYKLYPPLNGFSPTEFSVQLDDITRTAAFIQISMRGTWNHGQRNTVDVMYDRTSMFVTKDDVWLRRHMQQRWAYGVNLIKFPSLDYIHNTPESLAWANWPPVGNNRMALYRTSGSNHYIRPPVGESYKGSFNLSYHPKQDIKTGELVAGDEILLRYMYAERYANNVLIPTIEFLNDQDALVGPVLSGVDRTHYEWSRWERDYQTFVIPDLTGLKVCSIRVSFRWNSGSGGSYFAGPLELTLHRPGTLMSYDNYLRQQRWSHDSELVENVIPGRHQGSTAVTADWVVEGSEGAYGLDNRNPRISSRPYSTLASTSMNHFFPRSEETNWMYTNLHTGVLPPGLGLECNFTVLRRNVVDVSFYVEYLNVAREVIGASHKFIVNLYYRQEEDFFYCDIVPDLGEEIVFIRPVLQADERTTAVTLSLTTMSVEVVRAVDAVAWVDYHTNPLWSYGAQLLSNPEFTSRSPNHNSSPKDWGYEPQDNIDATDQTTQLVSRVHNVTSVTGGIMFTTNMGVGGGKVFQHVHTGLLNAGDGLVFNEVFVNRFGAIHNVGIEWVDVNGDVIYTSQGNDIGTIQSQELIPATHPFVIPGDDIVGFRIHTLEMPPERSVTTYGWAKDETGLVIVPAAQALTHEQQLAAVVTPFDVNLIQNGDVSQRSNYRGDRARYWSQYTSDRSFWDAYDNAAYIRGDHHNLQEVAGDRITTDNHSSTEWAVWQEIAVGTLTAGTGFEFWARISTQCRVIKARAFIEFMDSNWQITHRWEGQDWKPNWKAWLEITDGDIFTPTNVAGTRYIRVGVMFAKDSNDPLNSHLAALDEMEFKIVEAQNAVGSLYRREHMTVDRDVVLNLNPGFETQNAAAGNIADNWCVANPLDPWDTKWYLPQHTSYHYQRPNEGDEMAVLWSHADVTSIYQRVMTGSLSEGEVVELTAGITSNSAEYMALGIEWLTMDMLVVYDSLEHSPKRDVPWRQHTPTTWRFTVPDVGEPIIGFRMYILTELNPVTHNEITSMTTTADMFTAKILSDVNAISTFDELVGATLDPNVNIIKNSSFADLGSAYYLANDHPAEWMMKGLGTLPWATGYHKIYTNLGFGNLIPSDGRALYVGTDNAYNVKYYQHHDVRLVTGDVIEGAVVYGAISDVTSSAMEMNIVFHNTLVGEMGTAQVIGANLTTLAVDEWHTVTGSTVTPALPFDIDWITVEIYFPEPGGVALLVDTVSVNLGAAVATNLGPNELMINFDGVGEGTPTDQLNWTQSTGAMVNLTHDPADGFIILNITGTPTELSGFVITFPAHNLYWDMVWDSANGYYRSADDTFTTENAFITLFNSTQVAELWSYDDVGLPNGAIDIQVLDSDSGEVVGEGEF